MEGLIFSIKKYSIHDGPGIRVTFFFKGCPLNCIWCHNPEGISPVPETVILKRTVGGKEISRTEELGRYYSVDELVEIADKERIFINQSGGGVTFSGGEPLMQAGYLLEALKTFKEKDYHTAVDTSGYSPAESMKAIIPYTDLFLFDLKHTDDLKHSSLTGVSNSRIKENWQILVDSGKDLIIRIPVIPGLNDSPDSLEAMKRFILGTKANSLKQINLLPYHRTGSSKYKRLDIPYRMSDVRAPSRLRMKEIKGYFDSTGIKVKIGG